MQYKRIAITGPGAIGKTTILSKEKIQSLLNNENIYLINERDYSLDNNPYIDALLNKGSFLDAEKFFFNSQKVDILNAPKNKHVIFDRHMVDTFLYGEVFKNMHIFSKREAMEWDLLVKKYRNFLINNEKLDLLIICTSRTFQHIQKNRENSTDSRRKIELKHNNMFEEIYKKYSKDEPWYQIALKISKNIVWIFFDDNIDLENTFYTILSHEINL